MTDTRLFAVRRLALAALALLVAAVGCNLTANDPDPTIPAGVATVQGVTTATPFAPTGSAPGFTIPTTTPLPTITLTPVPTIVNCEPYTLWPAYVVQPGDTLGVIATLTGTTIATLQQRNCLEDPDAIYAGQLLYVPQLPPTPVPQPTATVTPEPNPELPIFEYPLTVQQDQFWVSNAGRAVTNRASVTLSVGMVDNANYVNFYVSDPGTGQTTLIGQDSTPWNGASAIYTFPVTDPASPQTYTFQAKAGNQVMEINSTPFTLIHNPNITPGGQPVNALTIQPNQGISGGWIQVAVGERVTIRWPNAPADASRVVFMILPTGTGSADLQQEIGTDLNPADGASIVWQATGSGHLLAYATMSGGAIRESDATQFVTVE